ncbi:MAG: hypothetical protein GX094_01225 [Clostridiales bacterium]|jgi:parvulin-like peptidyl-prolyl isomerase|nr:hypothetical protein [Clostridiales bacterium]
MKTNRYISLLLISIVFLVWLAGCGLVRIDPEKDRQRVVAEVDGEKILKGEFLDVYEQQKAFWGITEETEKNKENRDFINSIKKDILEHLVLDKVLEIKAREHGFTVNGEYEQRAREELEEQIKQYAELLKEQEQAGQEEQAEKEEETEADKDYLEEARKVWEEQLVALGISEDEYIKMLAKDLMFEAFSEKMLEDVTVTDGDIEKYYNENLSKQKEDPTLVQTAAVELYRPPGRVRIKHITIPLPYEERNEYYRIMQEESEEEADKYLKERLEAIKPKAQEAYDKAMAGENFETLIETYSEDTSSSNKDEGYIIYEGSGLFAAEVEKVILEMNVDEISRPLESPYGYHIIKLYEKLPEEVFSLEDKKEEIRTVVLEEKRNEKWNSLLEEWKNKAKIKKYENRL